MACCCCLGEEGSYQPAVSLLNVRQYVQVASLLAGKLEMGMSVLVVGCVTHASAAKETV
jgi:hypothetical protein